MATRDNALVVMTKAPRPGESKTRLVPPLTYEEAAALAEALLIDQLNHLTKLAGADVFVAFTPQNAAAFFRALVPARFCCFPQEGDDLGERMRQAFHYLLTRGFKRVLLIGSDLPPLPLETLHAAYASLSAGRNIVLGPTTDGGYYLIGMSRLFVDVFTGIHWSRPDVLARTLEKISRAKLSYELLPVCQDIDTPEDLAHLYREQQAKASLMKNSWPVLQELRDRGKLPVYS
ncbi:MAG TPA: TIGR04282 family arsenosugar biosynthesis glycosyltransferase [Candidatus Binatia bacterium]|nr:TIGR04282 family arsenosugar biosynthesis glycosyltransferase [Candidatus Binatia bacterium]